SLLDLRYIGRFPFPVGGRRPARRRERTFFLRSRGAARTAIRAAYSLNTSRCTVGRRSQSSPRPFQNIVRPVIRSAAPVAHRLRPLADSRRVQLVDSAQGDLDTKPVSNEPGDVFLGNKLRHGFSPFPSAFQSRSLQTRKIHASAN